MKYLLFLMLAVTMVLTAQDSTKTNVSAKTSTLTLTVNNLTNNSGKVMVALCNSKQNYEGKEEQYRGMSSVITSNTAVLTFYDLPYGEYGIKLFHDENNNNKMDSGIFGIPTEDYGFSNNASGSFGPASWEDAKFLIDKPGVEHEIDLDE